MPLNEIGNEAAIMAALLHPKEYIKAAVIKQTGRKCGMKNVKHSETCPVCGQNLVNLYPRNGAWKCKKCWDEDDHVKKGSIENVV